MKKTLQETFDEAVVQFRALTEAMIPKQLMYKVAGEDNCPVGRFIPAAKYVDKMEKRTCTDPIIASILLEEGYDPHFCRILQILHDSSPVCLWEHHLSNIANIIGFDFKPMTRLAYPLKEEDLFNLLEGGQNSWQRYVWPEFIEDFKKQVKLERELAKVEQEVKETGIRLAKFEVAPTPITV
jgi:hypothetical protein